ncbi:uncharacterized protein LOC110443109 isoform X2 [Mizuhopecten yessoensis]|uniref:PARP-type domain-containing protein n=1 Tax=Mizuhopecten yessoensis TaxID=6573 RepID=A0A210PFP5_MIZYE|nr:uncharacterized protein LOC110443109 isoform X2 [Mizuhopecten yessoensis]OWF35309.1 hypothetical protein KP79_PYT12058 [Mizuhopecten yessoensis]
MCNVSFCVEYNGPRAKRDECVVCGATIQTKGCLKMGCFSEDNQEEQQWYHFKCFWQGSKYKHILMQEDPNCPSFEGYVELKSTDKRKIGSALKELQKHSSEGTGIAHGLKSGTTNKDKASSSSSSSATRLETKTTRLKRPSGKHMFRIHKDSMKYIQIKRYRQGVFVTLTEFYWNESVKSWLPTSTSIRLSITEWEELYKGRNAIDSAIQTAERNLDEPPQKKKRDITGTATSENNLRDDMVLTLSGTRPVCVRTHILNDAKQVVVAIGFPGTITYTDGKPTLMDCMPVSLTTDEWANLMQLRPEINDDISDSFDVYCLDV